MGVATLKMLPVARQDRSDDRLHFELDGLTLTGQYDVGSQQAGKPLSARVVTAAALETAVQAVSQLSARRHVAAERV